MAQLHQRARLEVERRHLLRRGEGGQGEEEKMRAQAQSKGEGITHWTRFVFFLFVVDVMMTSFFAGGGPHVCLPVDV